MNSRIISVFAALALGTPTFAIAASLDCPDVPAVFGAADAATAVLSNLADKVGTAGQDEEGVDKNLYSIAYGLRKQYPAASDAEVADIMITAYCNWLAKAEPGNQQGEQEVRAFEQKVYQAVFEGPPPRDYQRPDWIRGN